jgi:membrane protein DedA with SNARE-associated domain
VHSITTFINHFVTDYVYIGVFVLMLFESACIPIPSEVTMLVGGYVVQKGQADFALVVALGVVGNLAGSLLAYGVGRIGGRPMISRFGRYVFLREHDVERAHRWFDRHGQPAVFFSRLLPVLRTFISLPAGVAEMPAGRFAAYTTAGCVPWVALLAWAGYLLGARWQTVVRYFTWASIVIAVVLIGVIARGVIRRRGRRRSTIADEPPPLASQPSSRVAPR